MADVPVLHESFRHAYCAYHQLPDGEFEIEVFRRAVPPGKQFLAGHLHCRRKIDCAGNELLRRERTAIGELHAGRAAVLDLNFLHVSVHDHLPAASLNHARKRTHQRHGAAARIDRHRSAVRRVGLEGDELALGVAGDRRAGGDDPH